jgi:hypothetical protein
MRAWLRLVLGDLVRGGGLLAGMVLAGTLLEGLLVLVAVGGGLLAGGPAGHVVGAALVVGLVGLPGAIGAAGLAVGAVDRRFPGRRVSALRGAADALGLRIALDVPGRFVALGDCAGRSVRLECLAMPLSHRVTIAARARAGGYGARAGRSVRQGLDLPWLQSIEDDPVGARALQLLVREGLGGSVLLLPDQVHATGHSGWFDGPDVLQERAMALLDLAELAERRPPSNPEGTASLRMVASVLPTPGASTPLVDLMSAMQGVALMMLGAMSAMSLGSGALLALLWPWWG